jgi:hypothetical protein
VGHREGQFGGSGDGATLLQWSGSSAVGSASCAKLGRCSRTCARGLSGCEEGGRRRAGLGGNQGNGGDSLWKKFFGRQGCGHEVKLCWKGWLGHGWSGDRRVVSSGHHRGQPTCERGAEVGGGRRVADAGGRRKKECSGHWACPVAPFPPGARCTPLRRPTGEGGRRAGPSELWADQRQKQRAVAPRAEEGAVLGRALVAAQPGKIHAAARVRVSWAPMIGDGGPMSGARASVSGREGSVGWATLPAGPRCQQQVLTDRWALGDKI